MAGKAPRTVPTTQDPMEYVASLENERRREEGQALLALMRDTTGAEAVMWGPSMIGFGTLHYRSSSGASEGETMRVGFSPRKARLTLYGLQGHPRSEELLAVLGKHSLGAGCVYALRLEHLDTGILTELVRHAFDDVVSTEVVDG